MRPLLVLCAIFGISLHYLCVFLGAAGAVAQTVEALWIPIAMTAFLLAFPIWAVCFNSTLFHGLFDLELSPRKLPIRHFLVTLAAFAVSASAWCIFRLMLVAGPDRLGICVHYWRWIDWLTRLDRPLAPCWLLAAVGPPLALAAFFAGFAVWVSWREGRSLARITLGVVAGLIVDALGGLLALAIARQWFSAGHTPDHVCVWIRWALIALRWLFQHLGRGYSGGYWADHAFATLAAGMVFGLYMILGYFGYRRLGTSHTIPALAGPLMSLLVLGWWGAAAQFFLDGWHIPLLPVIAIFAIANNFIPLADHTYTMVDRNPESSPAPPPFQVLTAHDRTCAIVAAAAGGGIQAAAWTAKVLEELHRANGPAFDESLKLISSISGGSMGAASYVNWLAHGGTASGLPAPFNAASASSLDEVSWGLAWPDLLRLFLPWPFGLWIDRAGAMERAWIGNTLGNSITNRVGSAPSAVMPGGQQLWAPLSDWNQRTAEGKLPALIMNSTMVEVGGPLLLGTSDVNGASGRASSVWMDGDQLHRTKSGKMDVPIVRAARLSATFPYVSPVARPANAQVQPHMIDGGFYDTYGIATLTEWLDQALEKQAARQGAPQVTKILVLKINGFPPPDFAIPPPPKTRDGYVKQLIAPLIAILNVRTAGQVSHGDIELQLLIDKWKCRGITITPLNFALNYPGATDGSAAEIRATAKKKRKIKNPPLSWHLMPSEIQAIVNGWDEKCVVEARERVTTFLADC
jgi:hypothetical protein